MYGNYNTQNVFTGIINQYGEIFEYSTGRQRVRVGIDNEKEQELLSQITELVSLADSYKDKLTEIALIPELCTQFGLTAMLPVKAPELIAQEAAEMQIKIIQTQADEQRKINEALLESIQKSNMAIQSLQSEIFELKGGSVNDYRNNTDVGKLPVGEDSKADGKVGKRSAFSDTTGKKATA